MGKFLFLLVPYCCKSNEDIIALHHLLYFIIEIILHFMNQSLQAITRRRKNICKPQKKLIEIYETGLVKTTPSLPVRSYWNNIKEYLLSRLNNYKNVWFDFWEYLLRNWIIQNQIIPASFESFSLSVCNTFFVLFNFMLMLLCGILSYNLLMSFTISKRLELPRDWISLRTQSQLTTWELYVDLLRFMRQMNTEKLFDEGNYMVIYLQPETVMNHERQFFLWNLEEMATVTVSQIKKYIFMRHD